MFYTGTRIDITSINVDEPLIKVDERWWTHKSQCKFCNLCVGNLLPSALNITSQNFSSFLCSLSAFTIFTFWWKFTVYSLLKLDGILQQLCFDFVQSTPFEPNLRQRKKSNRGAPKSTCRGPGRPRAFPNCHGAPEYRRDFQYSTVHGRQDESRLSSGEEKCNFQPVRIDIHPWWLQGIYRKTQGTW